MENANVGIIKQIATILDFRFIPLYFSQLIMSWPKILWFFNHFSNFFDDLEKNHALSKTNGVTGIPGKKAPRNANPMDIKPKERYIYFFNKSL